MGVDMELQGDLTRQGFTFSELKNLEQQLKATYYKADGTPLPNLPADSGSMKRYLARGLTLVPPNGVSGLVCVCGFQAKSKFGLVAHRRKHKKE